MPSIDATYLASANATLRLSDAERAAAVAALERDAAEGRLDAEELAKRTAEARHAVVRDDLLPLFADLPESVRPPETPQALGDGTRTLSTARRVGNVLVALSPFVAVTLFFLSGTVLGFAYAWLWFLIVPATAIIVYVGGGARR